MKRHLLFFALFVASFVSAQQNNLIDIVYLKNGSVLRGVIIEQVPNELIKLQTADGNVFVYQISEIDKITKEHVHNALHKKNNYNITNKGFKTKYWDGSRIITKAEFFSSLSGNSEAYRTYNHGKNIKTLGAFFYLPGAIVLGWELGVLTSGNNQDNNSAMIIGGVSFVGGLVLVLIGESQINKSLSILNSGSSYVALNISLSEFCLTFNF